MKVLIFDGSAVIHRAFHGTPVTVTDGEGNPVNALRGASMKIANMVDYFKPDLAVVAMEGGGDSWRRRLYPAYKANRKPTDPLLAQQFPLIEQFLGLAGLAVLRADGEEADDIIASFVDLWSTDPDTEIVIYTGDKDMLQLITGRVKVAMPSKTETVEIWDNAAVEARFGVNASQFRDYKSLVGDSSDNIKGVPGIGAVAAQRLLAYYGTLGNIYNNDVINNILPVAVRNKLRDGHEDAILATRLVSLNQTIYTVDNEPMPEIPQFRPAGLAEFMLDKGLSWGVSALVTAFRDYHSRAVATLLPPSYTTAT